jgi:hypothetical protein
MSNIETNTDASRILFIDSKDGENTALSNQLTTKYKVKLQDPIVVPSHHTLLLSLHRLNVPRTFYNFQHARNCGLEVIFLSFDGTNSTGSGWASSNLNRPPYLSFELDEGNYDAVSLMNRITTRINDYLTTGEAPTERQPHGTISLSVAQKNKYKLSMNYNRNTLKYEWAMDLVDESVVPTDGGIMMVFRWKTGELYGSEQTTYSDYQDTSIRQEVGFISNKWIDGAIFDFWLRYSPNATATSRLWSYGYGTLPSTYPITADWGLASGELREKTNLSQTQIDNDRYYFRGNDTPSGTPLSNNNYLSAVDVSYHTQNLYLHTSITQHSVLDTRIGGRFSDILARIPVDVDSGGEIVVSPSDGSVHKLILKVREITEIEVRLTDLNDKLIDTNGLDWTFSLEFDFIVQPQVGVKKDKRETIEEKKYEYFLKKTGKLEELKRFQEQRNHEKLPNV